MVFNEYTTSAKKPDDIPQNLFREMNLFRIYRDEITDSTWNIGEQRNIK